MRTWTTMRMTTPKTTTTELNEPANNTEFVARLLTAALLEGRCRRDLGDGRELRAEMQIFNAYVSIGKVGADGWDQAWFYPTYLQAVVVVKDWNPVEGDPPGPWTRTIYGENVPGLGRVSRSIRREPIFCQHGRTVGWIKYERH